MTTITSLPPELLDHITSYLPSVSSVSNLSRSNKFLYQAVEKDGWTTFNRSRFPSIQTPHQPTIQTSPSYQKDLARTLVTLSRNWDRRAFAARYIEPASYIRNFPSGVRAARWKRPRGQTIGFAPQLDSYEVVGQHWGERKEILALSAGAEICVREKKSVGRGACSKRSEDVQWVTYRPDEAVEGKDDVTALNLLRPRVTGEDEDELQVVRGTANGALELRTLPLSVQDEVPGAESKGKRAFRTDDLPVRSTSVLQHPSKPSFLAAALGETRIRLYSLTTSVEQENEPWISQLEIASPQSGTRSSRIWSTNFISPSHLAVGQGPGAEPIHIYTLTPYGILPDAVRKFSLKLDFVRVEDKAFNTIIGATPTPISSVYPIVPLPSTASGSGEGSLFLSGGYDGTILLHDLRSARQAEAAYVDPTDDSAVYSLLPRGREKLVVGTSTHSVMKVFDFRMGARCYSYHTATNSGTYETAEREDGHWNLYLKPHSATYPGRGGGNNWARRTAESSIYSLTSPSPTSPFIYAGVENAVVELAFTDLFDPAPDPAFFDPDPVALGTKNVREHGQLRVGDLLNLAMYEQGTTELMSQRSVRELRSLKGAQERGERVNWFIEGLDERWRFGTS